MKISDELDALYEEEDRMNDCIDALLEDKKKVIDALMEEKENMIQIREIRTKIAMLFCGESSTKVHAVSNPSATFSLDDINHVWIQSHLRDPRAIQWALDIFLHNEGCSDVLVSFLFISAKFGQHGRHIMEFLHLFFESMVRVR